jgi:hypothetical protein
MAININTISISGSVLLWLGVITCFGGLILFLAVCGGISPNAPEKSLHSHDTYYILIQGLRRLVYVLPLVAGLLLVASGLLIRRQIPTLEAMLMNTHSPNQEAEQAVDGNPH